MKNIPFIAIVIWALAGCQTEENLPEIQSVSYPLYQTGEYAFEGTATFELREDAVELLIQLDGVTSEDPYFYTGHLHFGNLDDEDATIAQLLSPIDSRTLQSRTVIGRLSNGNEPDFESLKNFDGHIKIHLADQGPDYDVILVSGNIGTNDTSLYYFNTHKIALCSPNYPE
ncbi:hypothetical protein [Cyclobacterium roseum]|uniref:hypothetical protein n=1 Tax=Cyclobacterium roseum TaxID=2666137 RepID=UPI0013910E04|nr:hypothetical protein [Cyclobacterium roseum]